MFVDYKRTGFIQALSGLAHVLSGLSKEDKEEQLIMIAKILTQYTWMLELIEDIYKEASHERSLNETVNH